MRESKQEQFHIGGVYRDIEGDVIRLCLDAAGVGAEFLDDDGEWDLHGGNFDLATGACLQARWCTLVPGELTQNASGEWVALGVEKPEAPKRVETLGELLRRALDRPLVRPGMTFVATVPGGLSVTPADLAMIARDGPAKPAAVVIPKPAEPTAKPAISGLQRVYSSTHLLGSYR